MYEALRRKDVEALTRLSSFDVSIQQSTEIPWGGTYIGIEQCLKFFGVVSSFLDSTVTVERMLDAGDTVAVVGRTAGLVRRTQTPFDVPLVHIWLLRDSKISSLSVYLDHPAILPKLDIFPT